MKDMKIPVTILSGFLGSGKTTLLNKLIKDNPDKKFAIIENEFGEIGIDNELVVGADNGIFEMSNGCVCCSLNDELLTVLQNLINSSHKIDHLIVETTGIADPGSVVLSFLSDFQIQSIFRLDAVIILCDAQFIEQQLERHEEACRQIVMADVILLNKVDTVENYQKDVVKNIIKRMNSDALIYESNHGECTGINLLTLQAFDKEKLLTEFKGKPIMPVQSSKLAASSLLTSPKQGYLKLQHSDIQSYSFVFPEPLHVMKFDIWIRILLNLKNISVYRVKGILNMADLPERLIFHSVNNQYMTEGGGMWKEGEEKLTKIVFIGKNLKREVLEKGIQICLHDKGEFNPAEFFGAMREFEEMLAQSY